MEKARTARDMFYFVEDVMAMLGYSKSKSYKIIARLNAELESAGTCTCSGRVSKKYFNKRYGLEDVETPQRARRASA